MPRPPVDQRISREEFESYLKTHFVKQKSAGELVVNGQKGIEFTWKISQKASPIVKTAILDYLSAAAYGHDYSTGAILNNRTNEVSMILYGKNAVTFMLDNYKIDGRGK